mgnify:CR=1 FL=1
MTITATDPQKNKVVDLSVLVQGEKGDEVVDPETNVWHKMAKTFGSSASITDARRSSSMARPSRMFSTNLRHCTVQRTTFGVVDRPQYIVFMYFKPEY